MQLQLHYTNCTTPQLQLHYATTTTTAALHHTTSSSCGWGDRPGDHCNHCSRSKRHSSNHLSVHQWIRSAIRDSQQPTSPIGFLFLKLPPPPCAELLLLLLILLLLYLLHSLTFSFLVVRSWFLIVKSLTYGSPCSEIRSIDFPWQAWGWQQRFVTCRSSGFVKIRQDSSGGFHQKSLNSLTKKIIKISGWSNNCDEQNTKWRWSHPFNNLMPYWATYINNDEQHVDVMWVCDECTVDIVWIQWYVIDHSGISLISGCQKCQKQPYELGTMVQLTWRCLPPKHKWNR